MLKRKTLDLLYKVTVRSVFDYDAWAEQWKVTFNAGKSRDLIFSENV